MADMYNRDGSRKTNPEENPRETNSSSPLPPILRVATNEGFGPLEQFEFNFSDIAVNSRPEDNPSASR